MPKQYLSSKRLQFTDEVSAIESYLEKGWSDGLPIIPPTVDRVIQFLDFVDRSASEIVCVEPVKDRIVTVEKVAINAVMAGCKMEYFPVVLAAVEAMGERPFNLHAISVSTMGAAILTVVNGPIAKDLSLNSGVNLFGPGHRANATIGRAIRLVMINATGAIPDVLDKATFGHPGKYTWCIAENDEANPWAPLHVRKGFKVDQSTVSIFAGLSPIQVGLHPSTDPNLILTSMKDALFTTGPGQDEIVVVLAMEHIGHLKTAGWSLEQVQQTLYEASSRPASEWIQSGVAGIDESDPDAIIGVANSPKSFTIVVAGGMAAGNAMVIQLWGAGSNSVPATKKI